MNHNEPCESHERKNKESTTFIVMNVLCLLDIQHHLYVDVQDE
jgi:hypothetical protein